MNASSSRPMSLAISLAQAAMRQVRLIGATTPAHAELEIERLAAEIAAGRPRLPRWEYRRLDVSGASERLDAAARVLRASEEPLRSLYSARIDELRLEAAMVESVGTETFGELARTRFRQQARVTRTADETALAWASSRATDDAEKIRSDADDPRSVLSHVRAAVGRHRAPFAVCVTGALSTLAATGERTVYIARGRWLSEHAAKRIAQHEVLGHVLPRVRAASAHPIFMLGTARGIDDQEGFALVHEDRAGLLDDARRVELARRHLAARAMRAGADFVEVIRVLADLGTEPRESAIIASRAFRGSDGRFAGLGRESVYIASFLRVRACLAKDPGAERVLSSGQVAVGAISDLAALAPEQPHFAGKHASPEPPPRSATL